MPVERRDANGNRTIGPNWESVTERVIREARERGEFDDLPLHGKPLPNASNPYAGEWELAFGVLQNANAAPPWIEADKEVRALRDRLQGLLQRARASNPAARARLERELLTLVAEHNRAVARVNAEAPGTRQHRRPLDPDAELRALHAAIHGSSRTDGEPA